MENFEEVLVHGSQDELQELKSWLFRENIRLVTASKELEEMQEQFLKEKVQFQEEMKLLNHRIAGERQRLKEDNQFFEKKMEILKNGFSQLAGTAERARGIRQRHGRIRIFPRRPESARVKETLQGSDQDLPSG